MKAMAEERQTQEERLEELAESEEEVMRLDNVCLGNRLLGKKSKIGLKMANSEGYVPDSKGRTDKLRITGLCYRSKEGKDTATIPFEEYNSLGCPEYIIRKDDGSILGLPDFLAPTDFPPREFD